MIAGDAARRAGVLIFVLICLFSLAAPGPVLAQGSCAPAATRLCLSGNRFQAEVAWKVPGLGSGEGHAVPLTADTGSFWFFSNSNLELMVKVLDGRAVNRHFWVFYGALSDVEYTLTVTDTATGARETYTNPAHRLASAADVSAFDAEAPPARAGIRETAVSTSKAPLRTGSEFQVNVTTAGDQVHPAVAATPDGSFMVVWRGGTFPLQQDNQADVYGRFYDSAGNPRGGELRLNETVPGTQSEPRVAVNSAGEFMVVWDDSGKGAQGRLFSADGSPLTGEITLAGGPNLQLHPDVTADPAGGFLVVWNEISSVPALLINQIHAQRFDAQGDPIGSPASFTALHLVLSLRVTGSPRGGYLVSWAQGQIAVDVAASDILAQRLDATGQALGGEIAVSEPFGAGGGFSFVTPVFYADGGFSVLWTSSPNFLGSGFNGLYGRRYAADGSAGAVAAFRSGFGVGSWAPAAVPLASGDTWVLWYGGGTLQHRDTGLSSGVFDPSWTLVSDVSQVNTYSAGEQVEPAVAASPGGIVAVWTSGSALGVDLPIQPVDGTQDGSGFGVFAQRFTAATCALSSGELCLGGRFRVAVQFTDPRSGTTGSARAIPLTGDTGAFWFFDPANLELMIKVLDGRAVNGHFWVFSGALSDVAYTVTVTDTQTGQSKAYHNAPHQLASRADVDAF
jgi:hypothetical protein